MSEDQAKRSVDHVLRNVQPVAFAAVEDIVHNEIRRICRDEGAAIAHAEKHGLAIVEPLCVMSDARLVVWMIVRRAQQALDAIENFENERTDDARQRLLVAAGDLRDAISGSPA